MKPTLGSVTPVTTYHSYSNHTNLNCIKKQPLTITTRAINEEKCDAINTRLHNIDWDNELHSKSANEAYTCFHTKMQEILNTESPIKTIKIKPNKVLKEPWMSPGLLRSIKKQKQLYKKTLIKNASVSGSN